MIADTAAPGNESSENWVPAFAGMTSNRPKKTAAAGFFLRK